ncbi:MAG: sulfatase-like hydrolase/transferase, partial [Bacteroidota bacterium]
KDARRFIRKNKDESFFLYLPFTIPHGKYQVPDDESYSDKPWPQPEKNYAAMITRMDKDIGEIFSLLDSLGLDENTVVFFASDNGGTKRMSPFFNSNGPFRGFKGDAYEGGIRAPLLVRWPGKIAPGQTSNHISAFWDILPTFAEIADSSIPRNIDGISFLPELLNAPQEEHEFLFWSYFSYNYDWEPGADFPRNQLQNQAVRKGKWKAVRRNLKINPDAPIELYDLSEDIGEKNNLAGQYPNVVEELKKIMNTEHSDTEFFRIN